MSIEFAEVRRSFMATDMYLCDAVRSIDKQFGAGYARDNPELVSAYIQACAITLLSYQSGADAQQAGVLSIVSGK